MGGGKKQRGTQTKKRGARLGQHLLTSRAIAREVGEAAEIVPNDTVLEIGPGKGMLTRELLALGAHVFAVEKDPGMVAVLRESFAEELASQKLTVIEDDIRNLPLLITHYSSLFTDSYKVAANIPYYITGEIIRLLLTANHQPKSIALLVQKEVAERIVKSKKESLLSLSVKAYGTPHYVRTVKAGSFNPPPNVDSAILAIHDISRKNFTDGASPVRGTSGQARTQRREREERFFELLHAGFGQKRKTLFGNIKKWLAGREEGAVDDTVLAKAFEECGLEKNVRAEDVPLRTWLQLSRLLQR